MTLFSYIAFFQYKKQYINSTGFNLTFQKWSWFSLQKGTVKLILNVARHVWATKKIFHFRLPKTALSHFLPFYLVVK